MFQTLISSVSVKITMTKYDLVIYGASGFTGQFVIEYVHRAAKEHQVSDPTLKYIFLRECHVTTCAQISWAVAGRNEGRLQAAMARAGAVVGADLSSGDDHDDDDDHDDHDDHDDGY